uniref:Secreted protein n=1 Tax=Heterorhabditis bacteriophora TaxID=37862 RepID=A0A1I7WGW7_HETBA
MDAFMHFTRCKLLLILFVRLSFLFLFFGNTEGTLCVHQLFELELPRGSLYYMYCMCVLIISTDQTNRSENFILPLHQC